MNRKDHRHLARDRRHGGQDPAEHGGLIDVRRPMQREHGVLAVGHRHAIAHAIEARSRQMPQQRVDHDVADQMNLLGRHAFGAQVLARIGRRRQQHVGQPIGHDPVDLLRHRAIVAAQAGLDVRHRDQQLRADE